MMTVFLVKVRLHFCYHNFEELNFNRIRIENKGLDITYEVNL